MTAEDLLRYDRNDHAGKGEEHYRQVIHGDSDRASPRWARALAEDGEGFGGNAGEDIRGPSGLP
jgi:hypothetical protein